MNVVTKKSVLIALAVIVAALIVIDIVLATDQVKGNTWSELLRAAAEHTPVVPWLWGLIMGHWFHPKDDQRPLVQPPLNALTLLGLSLLVLAIGSVLTVPPWLPLILALPIGALVWPVSSRRSHIPEIAQGSS